MASNVLYHFRSEMFLCELCNIKFTMENHLQKHCKTHHSADDGLSLRLPGTQRKSHLTCTDCDVSFENEKKLRAHRQTHTGSNQYACEECNAMFVTEEGLQSHTDLHKLSRFACSWCNLDFSHSIFLRLHCNRRHNDPGPESGNNRIKNKSSGGTGGPLESTKSESRFSHGYEVDFSHRNTIGGQAAAHVSTSA